MIKKIGIIGAIHQEIKTIKKIINIFKIQKNVFSTIYIGKFKKNIIFLIESGIGKVSASISTMILIQYNLDVIINSGSAGSLDSSLNIGDIIIPETICYHDVDVTGFGYALGQIPRYPKKFYINRNIYNFFKNQFIKHCLSIKTGLIISGDCFVNKQKSVEIIKKKFPTAIAVEMESAAIAQVCYTFNTPLIVIKSISDFSNEHSSVHFKKNTAITSLQSSHIVQIILKDIDSIL